MRKFFPHSLQFLSKVINYTSFSEKFHEFYKTGQQFLHHRRLCKAVTNLSKKQQILFQPLITIGLLIPPYNLTISNNHFFTIPPKETELLTESYYFSLASKWVTMLKLNVQSETSPLSAVILGTAKNNGPTPLPQEAYDPKSLEHILAGTYPKEKDMRAELDCFHEVLERYGVQVYRPEVIDGLNQIFTRDIGFVIDNCFIKSNILPDRAREWQAIQHIIQQINPSNFKVPPPEAHIEGGDVILWKEYIFIGTYLNSDYRDIQTARTNMEGVRFIQEQFPYREVRAFDLIKSNTDPRANALHLDCCFQPVGSKQAIVYPGGFRNPKDYQFIQQLFGKSNLFEIDAEGMYQMYSNVFSISPQIVVSEQRFTRLNEWLTDRGITVEEIPYHEIGKQEGLLRCSTLPLIRK